MTFSQWTGLSILVAMFFGALYAVAKEIGLKEALLILAEAAVATALIVCGTFLLVGGK
jgi:uncharacterized membrane protein